MPRQKRFGILIVMLVLGLLIGTAVGEAIALILPEGVVRDFFLHPVTPSFGPVTVNLVAFTFTIGFSFKVNIMAVLGVILATYLYRWY
jgi:hypothetical protein